MKSMARTGIDIFRMYSLLTKLQHRSLPENLHSFCYMAVHDLALPMLEALSHERTAYMIDMDDYKTELVTGLSEAWRLA